MSVPRGVDFETAGDEPEYWRLERFDLLAVDFGVEVEDLPEWHAFMQGEGCELAWAITERLYQVGSLTGAGDDILRTWNRGELGKKFSIPVKRVDLEIETAAKRWKLAHARSDLERDAAAAGTGADDIDLLTSFNRAGDMEDEKVNRLLEAYNFKEIKDPMMRIQVAKRILSLKDYLISPHTRTTAREIIRMENAMHSLEKTLTGIQNQLDDLIDEDPGRAKNGTKIDELSKKIDDLNKQIRLISLSHSKAQKSINADDIDMTTRKRIFVETVAFIQEKCREYESDPANVLLDGVFRAGEIDWLMDPLGERGPQYRPDIVVRLGDALLKENLWDPEYVPPPIAIRVTQELRKIVETMRQIPEDAPPLVELDEDDDSAVIGDGLEMALESSDESAEPADAVRPFGRQREDADSPCMDVY